MGLGLAILGSSLIGGASSLFGNQASAKQAKKQMDFQEMMSNTAYSRAVKDMRQAGLNPVLAAGSPASTPGGAMGQVQNLGEAVAKGATTAIALKQGQANVRQAAAVADQGEFNAKIAQDMRDYWEANPQMHDEIMRSMWHQKAGQGSAGAAAGYIGELGKELGSSARTALQSAADRARTKYNDAAESSRQTGRDVLNSAKRAWRQVRKGYEDSLYTPRQQTWRNTGRIVNPKRK